MPTFISHDMDDASEYRQLVDALTRAGIAHWDPKSMTPGMSLRQQLIEGIDKCDNCVFLATRQSVESRWCGAELGAFWSAGKRVVVFLADPRLTKNDLPPQYQDDLAATDVEGVIRALGTSELAAGTEGTSTIAFFSRQPRDHQKREVIRRAVGQDSGTPRGWSVFEAPSLDALDDDHLGRWTGLFLGMPHGQLLSQSLVRRIVTWVRTGGNLVVTGFELGERHHGTNINQLASPFGLLFNSDVVTASTVTNPPKDYDVTLKYNAFASADDGLLDGVQSLAMRNACSLHLAPGARPVVYAHPNRIRELTPGAVEYGPPPAFQLAPGSQTFDKGRVDKSRVVAALAPSGLTLRGRVLAVGSWDFRCDGVSADNDRFLQNVWRWLATPVAAET